MKVAHQANEIEEGSSQSKIGRAACGRNGLEHFKKEHASAAQDEPWCGRCQHMLRKNIDILLLSSSTLVALFRR